MKRRPFGQGALPLLSELQADLIFLSSNLCTACLVLKQLKLSYLSGEPQSKGFASSLMRTLVPG